VGTVRKAILYIAASLDGYIAGPGDDLSFLSRVEKPGEDYGYAAFMKTVDTVLLGRKTYDWVMTRVKVFPHTGLKTYVFTRKQRSDNGLVQFHSGDPGNLLRQLKGQSGRNIFIDGGAEIIHTLLRDKLIDEFYVSIIPVLLGSGTRLFRDERPEQNLKLVSSQQYTTGLVQLHYTIA